MNIDWMGVFPDLSVAVTDLRTNVSAVSARALTQNVRALDKAVERAVLVVVCTVVDADLRSAAYVDSR